MPNNPPFNNQIVTNDTITYSVTQRLKKQIVAQLRQADIKQQEEIIEGLLKLLDVNLVAALAIAYATAPAPETKAQQEH